MNGGNGSGPRVPAWLSALGVKEGEYFSDSKLRWKRAMKAECFCPPARIYACLGLHTMSFSQELAVKMEAGKRVHLTPQDVCAETGLPLKHFREQMQALDVYGLAKIKGSTKGRVELYAWAVPRPVEVKKIVPARGTIFPGFSGFSPAVVSLLKHYRIRIPETLCPARGDIIELERLARVTNEAELSLRAFANGLRARNGSNKEVINDVIEAEINAPAPSVVVSVPPAESVSLSVPETPTDRPTDTSTAEIRALLLEELGPKLPDETPSPALCRRIRVSLQGAPLDNLRFRIRKRLRSITSMGMVADLAKDVGDRWVEDAKQQQQITERPIPKESPEQARKRAQSYLDHADSPQLLPQDLEWARGVLGIKVKTAGDD